MKNVMQFLSFALLVASICLITTGCPVGIGYAPGNPGSEKIDQKLLGTWVALDEEAEMQKVLLAKKDDFSYTVDVLEYSEFSADG
jgi:hypothetical protein